MRTSERGTLEVEKILARFASEFIAIHTLYLAWKEGYVGETDKGLATHEPPAKDRKAPTYTFRPEVSSKFIGFVIS